MRITGSLNVLNEPLGIPQSCTLDIDLCDLCDREGKGKRVPVTGQKVALITVNSNSKIQWVMEFSINPCQCLRVVA